MARIEHFIALACLACSGTERAQAWTADAQRYIDLDMQMTAVGPSDEGFWRLYEERERAAKSLAGSAPDALRIDSAFRSGEEPLRRWSAVAVLVKPGSSTDVYKVMLDSYAGISDYYTRRYVAQALGKMADSQAALLSDAISRIIEWEPQPSIVLIHVPLLPRLDRAASIRVCVGLLRRGPTVTQRAVYAELVRMGDDAIDSAKRTLAESGDTRTLDVISRFELSRTGSHAE